MKNVFKRLQLRSKHLACPWVFACLLLLPLAIFAHPQQPTASHAVLTTPSASPSSLPPKAQKAKKQLYDIKKQIAYLRHTLTDTRHKRAKLVKALEVSELSIHTISSKLHHIKTNIRSENKKIQALDRQRFFYQTQLNKQKQQLAYQLQQAYQLRYYQAKPFFWRAESPDAVNRLFVYHQYLSRDYLHQLNEFQRILQKIHDNRQSILKHTQTFNQLGKQLKQQHRHIKTAYTQRQHIIKMMAADIKTQQQKLAVLSANEHKLNALIKALTIHPASPKKTALYFKQHHGRLPWPTPGRIIHHFGTRIEGSEIRWKAVVIQAPSGQAVRAVAPGRVVFAGWMPQYGLLIIVDHGQGYLSLYGYNQQLYHRVGDTIRSRDLIARVGNTGGHKTVALYFGLWHNSSKLNPERWCTKG